MDREQREIKEKIVQGRTFLGIELGSTRIKAVLIDDAHHPIASGSYEWENRYEHGIWTYHNTDIWTGIQECYHQMRENVRRSYAVDVETIGGMGISGMMHGYLAFDAKDELLVPFRTWRNTITAEASEKLSDLFAFPIPQRWSIAHLYQAMLNEEPHVKQIHYLTTLAGYIHWKLTGEKVLGVGEASGMFPIDSSTGDFSEEMIAKFDSITEKAGYPWNLKMILPQVLTAGKEAGQLTERGAALLDRTGSLKAGVPLCPPEGDAGTGMTATNSVAQRRGNVSAGTSVFSMIVLEQDLKNVHSELDLVTTPAGKPVAMVHCNNCTSDLNAWVNLFEEFASSAGMQLDREELYALLYRKALEGDADCGGLLAYNYLSGEPITGFEEGRPLFLRTPDSRFHLANFMRTHLFSAMATLKIGMDILLKEEQVSVDEIVGHGGLFKTAGVGQNLLAGALNVPVSVMETAGEGGAWGAALLAAYMQQKKEAETLEDYLEARVFAEAKAVRVQPKKEDVQGFETFLQSYKKGLKAERAALDFGKVE